MAVELKKTFAEMLLSSQNYINPSKLIDKIVNDKGTRINTGE
jgi:hypothetical protein